MGVTLTRAQRRIAQALAGGGHLQRVSTCDRRCYWVEPDYSSSWETLRESGHMECARDFGCDDDPDAFYVLVHPDSHEDADDWYAERVQYRTLWHLHMAGLLTEDAEIVAGF